MREKIICKCGNQMQYEGLEETALLFGQGMNNPIVSDLEVFLCPDCENKLWIHTVS
jgi:uncharacterized protein YlaI